MMTRLALFLSAMLAIALPASASELERPSGDIILTVTGNIARTNAPDAAEFDLAMLEALAGDRITTETPWFEGTQTFEGPLLSDLLDTLGAEGETLRVTAINDYAAEIPISEIRDYPVILATRLNGRTMSIRDKGPSFVIYPFDRAPELYDEVHFGRSVWQVTSIEIF